MTDAIAPGYYRNPQTEELWRLRRPPRGGLLVAKYSKSWLTPEGSLVKGTWKSSTGFDARLLLARGEIKRDWLLTEDDYRMHDTLSGPELHLSTDTTEETS